LNRLRIGEDLTDRSNKPASARFCCVTSAVSVMEVCTTRRLFYSIFWTKFAPLWLQFDVIRPCRRTLKRWRKPDLKRWTTPIDAVSAEIE
jgi:hypothetical protein